MELNTATMVTIDVEAAGLEAATDPGVTIWGATFTTDSEGTLWVVGWDDVVDTLSSYIEDGFTPVFHNGKFDVRVFAVRGINIPEWHDTKVMSYQLWPGYPSHSLEDVAKRLRLPQNKLKLPDDWDWNNPDHDVLEKYAIRDGQVQHQVLHKLVSRMDKFGVLSNYLEVDLPYELETIYMEDTGLYVAPAQREAMQNELEEVLSRNYRIATDNLLLVPARLEWSDGVYVPQAKTYTKKVPLLAEAEPTVGYFKKNGVTTYDHCELKELNLNSSRHVCWVMQEVVGWEPHQFTDKTCEPSTGVEHMSTFDHPFVDAYLNWQQASKIHGTFLEAFEKHSDSDGFVHGRFNTTVTATGRLSSSQPNLQNVPTRSSLGQRVRELFTPPPGSLMWGGDLSNIELRVLARDLEVLVGESSLADAFRNGEDVHWSNARAFGFIELATRLITEAGLELTDGLLKAVARNALAKTATYACVPMDTQALSKDRGWVGYEELNIGDLVLVYNPDTNRNEWQPVLDKVKYEDAPTVEWKDKHGFYARSTPNHRWYGSRRREVANGYRYYHDLEFTTEQANSEYIIKVSAPSDGGDGVKLDRLLNKYTEDSMWPKLVLDMTESERWLWFSANIATDGHIKKPNPTTGRSSCSFSQDYTKQPGLYDAMVLAGTLLGYRVTQHSKGDKMKVATFNIKSTVGMQRMSVRDYGVEDVWCISVPSGFWVMKQRDSITITGNTLYGGGANAIEVGASRGLPFKLPPGTGKLVIDTMDENLPAITELKKVVWRMARKNGGVIHTVGGRPLLVRQIVSKDRELRAAGERKAFNYRLQGTAAEIMKRLHLETAPYIESMGATVAAAVHDELLGYTWHTDLDKANEMVLTLSHHFSTAPYLGDVPIQADFSLGPSWGDIH